MTNDPRNPLPGEQPGTPQNPEQSSGMGSQSSSPGQQPDLPGGTPETGTSATSARSAPSARPTSASDERTYPPSEPSRQATATTTRTYESPQSAQPASTRTYDAPPRTGKNTRMLALLGIAGLVAGGGIVAGFAASNNSTPTAAIHGVPGHVRAAGAGHLVATVGGTGTKVSAPFSVTGAPIAARYTYRCGSGTHPFVAAIAQSRTNLAPITSTRGTGGTATVTLHPRSAGTYRLAASSPCPYHVSVFQR
jgi:hypothetical protein